MHMTRLYEVEIKHNHRSTVLPTAHITVLDMLNRNNIHNFSYRCRAQGLSVDSNGEKYSKVNYYFTKKDAMQAIKQTLEEEFQKNMFFNQGKDFIIYTYKCNWEADPNLDSEYQDFLRKRGTIGIPIVFSKTHTVELEFDYADDHKMKGKTFWRQVSMALLALKKQECFNWLGTPIKSSDLL